MDSAAAIRATIPTWRKACPIKIGMPCSPCVLMMLFAPRGESQVSGSKIRPWLEVFPIMKAFDFKFDRVDVMGTWQPPLEAGLGLST